MTKSNEDLQAANDALQAQLTLLNAARLEGWDAGFAAGIQQGLDEATAYEWGAAPVSQRQERRADYFDDLEAIGLKEGWL